jgi:hypothetical protein
MRWGGTGLFGLAFLLVIVVPLLPESTFGEVATFGVPLVVAAVIVLLCLVGGPRCSLVLTGARGKVP